MPEELNFLLLTRYATAASKGTMTPNATSPPTTSADMFPSLVKRNLGSATPKERAAVFSGHGIGECFVRLGYLGGEVISRRWIWIFVRMVFQRQFSIGFLDLPIVGPHGHTQDFKGIEGLQVGGCRSCVPRQRSHDAPSQHEEEIFPRKRAPGFVTDAPFSAQLPSLFGTVRAATFPPSCVFPSVSTFSFALACDPAFQVRARTLSQGRFSSSPEAQHA
eukprot:scaffold1401_cov330-Pavlova_lutheri.AAC.3